MYKTYMHTSGVIICSVLRNKEQRYVRIVKAPDFETYKAALSRWYSEEPFDLKDHKGFFSVAVGVDAICAKLEQKQEFSKVCNHLYIVENGLTNTIIHDMVSKCIHECLNDDSTEEEDFSKILHNHVLGNRCTVGFSKELSHVTQVTATATAHEAMLNDADTSKLIKQLKELRERDDHAIVRYDVIYASCREYLVDPHHDEFPIVWSINAVKDLLKQNHKYVKLFYDTSSSEVKSFEPGSLVGDKWYIDDFLNVRTKTPQVEITKKDLVQLYAMIGKPDMAWRNDIVLPCHTTIPECDLEALYRNDDFTPDIPYAFPCSSIGYSLLSDIPNYMYSKTAKPIAMKSGASKVHAWLPDVITQSEYDKRTDAIKRSIAQNSPSLAHVTASFSYLEARKCFDFGSGYEPVLTNLTTTHCISCVFNKITKNIVCVLNVNKSDLEFFTELDVFTSKNYQKEQEAQSIIDKFEEHYNPADTDLANMLIWAYTKMLGVDEKPFEPVQMKEPAPVVSVRYALEYLIKAENLLPATTWVSSASILEVLSEYISSIQKLGKEHGFDALNANKNHISVILSDIAPKKRFVAGQMFQMKMPEKLKFSNVINDLVSNVQLRKII